MTDRLAKTYDQNILQPSFVDLVGPICLQPPML